MTCIIFDLDGTLVDSEEQCNQAFLDLIPELGETVDALVSRYRGKQFSAIISDIETRLRVRLSPNFETLYRQRVAVLFDENLNAMPGAEDTLNSIDLPICIASSGPMSKIRHSLRLTGLDRFFGNRIYSAYDVGSWKPDPGLFIYAAKDMGFTPSQCTVVEDSPVGIEAAVAAGMRAIQFIPDLNQSVAPGAIRISDLRDLDRVVRETWGGDDHAA